MARYIGPKCKLSRREGTDLFLKSGIRPLESKCKAEQAPGQAAGASGRRPAPPRVQLAKSCCSCLKFVWITWFTAWASALPALKRVSW